jgi:phage baseplate assembly protein W
MSLVVIDALKAKDKNKPLYVDIKLDLKQKYTNSPKLMSKDVVADFVESKDLDAIKNSIFNLFTTIPGEKILNPTYGLNLLQFIFTGITEESSRVMGDLIVKGIGKYEPRLKITKVYIFPDIDEQTYQIGLKLDVPSLNLEGISIKGTLSESGFYLI